MKNMYFTGVALADDAKTCYVGKTFGNVWSVDLEKNSFSVIRDAIAGDPFNGTYFLSFADAKLWMLSEKGFISAYNPQTGEITAPIAQFDYPTRGIAFYEYAKGGIVITLK
jgi:hypothetical protein